MGFLRRLFITLQQSARRFMQGRYGTDKLNTAILVVGVVCCILSMLIPASVAPLIFTTLSYGFMVWAIFRMLSRNHYKRYQENRWYLRFIERLKDREHRYYDCPRCKRSVRVPRGKGKIELLRIA